MKDPGLINDNNIEAYAKSVSTADSPLSQSILTYTETHMSDAHMLSGPLVARLLQLLVKLNQAEQVLDIGTFTGYSALALKEALPQNAKVYTCEQDEAVAKIATDFFAQSKTGAEIQLVQGDALSFLQNTQQAFDLIFLDADKGRLKDYYEAAISKLSKKGILIIDDILWRGEVLAPTSKRAQLINALNHHIKQDTRVINVLLPIRHGLQLIMLKS